MLRRSPCPDEQDKRERRRCGRSTRTGSVKKGAQAVGTRAGLEVGHVRAGRRRVGSPAGLFPRCAAPTRTGPFPERWRSWLEVKEREVWNACVAAVGSRRKCRERSYGSYNWARSGAIGLVLTLDSHNTIIHIEGRDNCYRLYATRKGNTEPREGSEMLLQGKECQKPSLHETKAKLNWLCAAKRN